MTLLVKNPIDAYVGAQIKHRRTLMGLSQKGLASGLGITFQQVQKYENGMNRIGSSRLYEISKILGVPLQSFFEGVEDVIPGTTIKMVNKRTKDVTLAKVHEFINSPGGVSMIRAFVEIDNPEVCRQIAAFIRSVSTSLRRT